MSTTENITRSRIALFEKDGIFGIVSLAITQNVNVVGRMDPRQQEPVTFKAFETPALAEHWFEEYIIATVTENAWSLAYNGPRNFG